MPLADAYLDAIKRFEGYTPRATWDYKQNSVGYGTRARYPGEVIDRAEAERRLQAELSSARNSVRAFAPNLSPGQEAALTSLTYNAGPGWQKSGLGAAVQAGDWSGAKNRFLQYNKAGGNVLPGLVSRRQAEASWIDGTAVQPTGQPAQPLNTEPQRMPLGDASPMPQPQGGNWLDQITTNPLFLMGAGVLGAPNIGQGIMQGVTASNQMRRQAAQDAQSRELFPLQKQLLQAQAQKAGQPPTSSDITEYEYAKRQGFGGSFADWMTTKRAAVGYGKTPIYGVGPDGKPVIMQLGAEGKAVQTQLPEGVQLSKDPIKMDAGTHFVLIDPITRQPVATVPKENEQAARDTAMGKAQGAAQAQAQINLPQVEANYRTVKEALNAVMNDPNLDSMIGYRGYLPNVTPQARAFDARIKQLGGIAFLQAFESLKGGGQITEVEGRKATEAKTRFLEMVQSGKDYRQALKDFATEVDRLYEVARKKAAGVGGTPQAGTPTRLRYNPETGALE